MKRTNAMMGMRRMYMCEMQMCMRRRAGIMESRPA